MIERVLAEARERIERFTPAQAATAAALIVDLRCGDVRARTGVIPGSVHVPRSVLEWRCDRDSRYANPCLVDRKLILVCEDGWSSSLAAASLRDLGVDAGDVVGGFAAWVRDGGAVVACPDPSERPGMGGPA